jgi:hypothetical protein
MTGLSASNPSKRPNTDTRWIEQFVRAEYWRLARAGRIPYNLPVCPPPPTRVDHR